MSREMERKHYRMLGINLIVSLVIMYLLMFSMIWSFSDFFNNSNMLYMAVTMAAPMGILMLLMMPMMYPDKRLNMILYGLFALLLVGAFWGIRAQALVADEQFVRAMIPHHSGAIQMCNRAAISDPEIRDLCFKPNGIVESQTREIAPMKAISRPDLIQGERRKSAINLDCARPRFTAEAGDTRLRPCAGLRERGAAPEHGRWAIGSASAARPRPG